MNTLLAMPEAALLALEYGLCLLLVLLSLIMLVVMRRRRRKELRAEMVVKSCKKALIYAEEMLNDKEDHKGKHILLGSTKLGRLSGLISESAWYAYQIGYKKQDLFFEEISKTLDGVAELSSSEAENVYILVSDYIACTEQTIERLRTVIEKIEAYQSRA